MEVGVGGDGETETPPPPNFGVPTAPEFEGWVGIGESCLSSGVCVAEPVDRLTNVGGFDGLSTLVEVDR